jgi:16S rRNA (adenine1518-N6/adenine1519-N6)-dimethyltransferase
MLRELADRGSRPGFPLDTGHLDQHLLVDPAAVTRLVDAADVGPGDVVADVGAGLGIISAAAAARGAAVVALEIDPRFAGALQELRDRHPEVSVRMVDAAEADLAGVDKVVANPPFGLLEPLLTRLVDLPEVRVVAMVVGRRTAEAVLAGPGEDGYGRLTLLVGAYFDVEVAATLPPAVFHPPPRTAAAIVVLNRAAADAPGRRVLRVLARATTFHGGQRVRDTAAAITRVPGREGDAGLRREDLSDPAIWNRRLQQLSAGQLGTLVVDVRRWAASDGGAAG